MKIAVLFDGAGLARLGLEQAGHECTGYELDPSKHYLSTFVGSGNSILADATSVDLSGYDAVWQSPPCQFLSSARTQGAPVSAYAVNYLEWSLSLVQRYPEKVFWIENVVPYGVLPTWGKLYNAAQFQARPVLNRPRLIGGRHKTPFTYRSYRPYYDHLSTCPTITATEYKGCATDVRRASRYYGRKLTLEECAYHQGFIVPDAWYAVPGWHKTAWRYNLYEAIGNGVPVYMARAFGEAYTTSFLAQQELWKEAI